VGCETLQFWDNNEVKKEEDERREKKA